MKRCQCVRQGSICHVWLATGGWHLKRIPTCITPLKGQGYTTPVRKTRVKKWSSFMCVRLGMAAPQMCLGEKFCHSGITDDDIWPDWNCLHMRYHIARLSTSHPSNVSLSAIYLHPDINHWWTTQTRSVDFSIVGWTMSSIRCDIEAIAIHLELRLATKIWISTIV